MVHWVHAAMPWQRDGNVPDMAPGEPVARFLVTPNRSISRDGVVLLVAGYASVVAVIGLGFAVLGAWLVLPFAGLEALVVAVAGRYLLRHRDDYELIVAAGRNLRITQVLGGRTLESEFPRYWARVTLEERGAQGARLMVGAYGRWLEIAAALTEEERQALRHELLDALKVAPVV